MRYKTYQQSNDCLNTYSNHERQYFTKNVKYI